jgi:polysaccharide biosynthesis/export protein
MRFMRFIAVFLILGTSSPLLCGQSPTVRQSSPSNIEGSLLNGGSSVPMSISGNDYRIGRDDLLEISVFEVPELSSSARVSASGSISLPLIGIIEAANLTSEELAEVIQASLKKSYINDPRVTVFVREYASQPVSVIGAVRLPGIYQIKGEKFLLDMLAQAGGLDLTAGRLIQIMRRPQPSDSQQVATEGATTLDIDVEDLFQNGKTELNISIHAGDVINVLTAASIFVVGEVVRPDEFVLRNGRSVTVTQAIGRAGGFTKEAKKAGCVIIRYGRDDSKEEIPVNIGRILQGLDADIPMMQNDILFVPANRVKTGLTRALDSVLSVAIGRAIYIR